MAAIFQTLGGQERVLSHPPWAERLETMYTVAGGLQQLMNKVDALETKFEAKLLEISDVVNLRTDVAVLKEAVAGLVAVADGAGNVGKFRFRVPEPTSYCGDRKAKELENFLWDLEQYFKAAHVPEQERVSVAGMYLSGDAKLWWRTRTVDDSLPRIETWDDLKHAMQDQFLPTNTSWMAREALRKLKHSGTVRDYVKEFSSLLLDIRDMSDEDKLFNFMSGLQSWAQTELRRQNVQNLSQAITAADRLVDFRLVGGQEKQINGDRNANGKFSGKQKTKVVETSTSKTTKEPEKTVNKGGAGCYICGGPHLMRNCPEREALSAALTVKNDGNGEGEVLRVNPMQMLNAISVEEGSWSVCGDAASDEFVSDDGEQKNMQSALQGEAELQNDGDVFLAALICDDGPVVLQNVPEIGADCEEDTKSVGVTWDKIVGGWYLCNLCNRLANVVVTLDMCNSCMQQKFLEGKKSDAEQQDDEMVLPFVVKLQAKSNPLSRASSSLRGGRSRRGQCS